MDLLTYINDLDRRRQLAEAAGTSPDYLWQVATGWRGRKPSVGLAQRLHKESLRLGPEAVSLQSLRPDVWGDAINGPH